MLREDYVDTVNTDDLVEQSIEQILDKLDPHTVYISARDRELAQSQLRASFDGIGVEFNLLRDTIYVVQRTTRWTIREGRNTLAEIKS